MFGRILKLKRFIFLLLTLALFGFLFMGCLDNTQTEDIPLSDADNVLDNENSTKETDLSENKIEKESPEIFTSMTDDIWNSADMEHSGFSNKDDFLTETKYYIAAISDFTSRKDKTYKIEYKFTDGVSMAYSSSNVIELKKDLFEHALAPIAHETTHIVCPNKNSTSLSEGFAEYCQDIFGKNPSPQSYGLDADAWTNYLLDSSPDSFEILFPDIGNSGIKDTFIYNELRQFFYLLSSSFVKYLINSYGIDNFMLLYESDNLKNDYDNIYEKPFDDLKAEWRQYIENYSEPISAQNLQDYLYELYTSHNFPMG